MSCSSRYSMKIVKAFFSAITVCFIIFTDSNANFPEINQSIGTVKLSGKAKLKKMLWHVYDVSLWISSPQFTFNAPFALSVEYKMNVSQKKIVDSSIDEMSRYADIRSEVVQYKRRLHSIIPSVKGGDRLTAIFIPKKNLTFYLNGQFLGRINDKVFAKRYMEIWLHPNVYYKEMRSLKGQQ